MRALPLAILAALVGFATACAPPKATTESPPASTSPTAVSGAPPPNDAGAPPELPRGDAGAGAPGAEAEAPPPPPTNVKVVTIGMHVAGGPFDEPTKAPFKKAVEPHFPEMLACFPKLPAPAPKSVDVGVDLLIEAAGGRPKVTNPRLNIAGVKAAESEFGRCIVAVFESVEFPKLVDRGRTGVSYSLRFAAK